MAKQILRYLGAAALVIGGSLSSIANADPLCVSNAAEYETHKADLPKVIQKLPALLTVSNFLVTAGLKIREADGKLKLEGSVWKPGDIYSSDSYVSQACFDKNVLTVTMEDKTSYSATIKGDTSVSISGQTFKQTSDADYAAVIEKVKAAESKKAATAAQPSGTNAK